MSREKYKILKRTAKYAKGAKEERKKRYIIFTNDLGLLYSANFEAARAAGIDLRFTDLRNANLGNANLDDTSFKDADLRRARLITNDQV